MIDNKIIENLERAVHSEVSDIFIVVGLPISIRRHGKIERVFEDPLTPEDTDRIVREIYTLADNRDISRLETKGDDDFSFALPGISRFRISAYKQRGTLSAVIRLISFELPDPKDLGIPDHILNLGHYKKGMVLVTGPAGSGKSTTLSCIIEQVNKTQEKHIITLEDPLEYLHQHNKSIVSQREINVDTESYVTALRASLRQSPDIILLGEMRDYETIGVAMTAAETGHLLFSTLHTIGASNTIDRIIDVFPANQQKQISVQLAMSLRAVISQQLVPTTDGRRALAYEIMTVTPAIRNMIRENKVHQIEGLIYSSAKPDMISMDNSLLELFKAGRITKETALNFSTNPDMLVKKLV
ncbi:MAG: PilT/PilU family type 4a pilus ATPase [Lachnospiraceae bacterium]|nr:PilT/PilU family type 4a pilus ATPase [Lachnospiraceae bacterium]